MPPKEKLDPQVVADFETWVKRGLRVVHGDKELVERLGRRDPCPCGSGRRFQELLPGGGAVRGGFAVRVFP